MADIAPLLALGFSSTIEARLKAKLAPAENGCIEWTGATAHFGYGHMTRGARGAGYEPTHRVAWMLEHGPIPEGMIICHRCDNPPCCNPDHLFLGTPADNMHDMWSKERGVAVSGERHHDAKLTDAQVAQLRLDHASVGNYAEIGRRYGVSKQHARALVLGMKRKS